MTIPCGVLVEIVLMILFCRIEILQRLLLNCQRLLIVLLFFGKHLFDNRKIL